MVEALQAPPLLPHSCTFPSDGTSLHSWEAGHQAHIVTSELFIRLGILVDEHAVHDDESADCEQNVLGQSETDDVIQVPGGGQLEYELDDRAMSTADESEQAPVAGQYMQPPWTDAQVPQVAQFPEKDLQGHVAVYDSGTVHT